MKPLLTICAAFWTIQFCRAINPELFFEFIFSSPVYYLSKIDMVVDLILR